MKLKYEYWAEDFRKAFRYYLKKKHEDWNEKTISTIESDAFFLFRYNSEEEAWRLTIESEHTEDLRSELEDILVQRKNSKKDAAGYLRAIKELREFARLVRMVEDSRRLKPREIQLSFDV